MAIWLVVNYKNAVSSHEIARDLKVTQKSAWFMLHRIRLALRTVNWDKKMGGSGERVEADETFAGGKGKNMHLNRRAKLTGSGAEDKAVAFGILDRETRKVRAEVIPNVRRDVLHKRILDNVEKGTTFHTDGRLGYHELTVNGFVHEAVNHVTEYVRDEVHTNRIENLWSLLKHGINGT